MPKKAFIQTNNKQLFGARLAKFAIERYLADRNTISVEIINVDELPAFQSFSGKTYLRNGVLTTYNRNDLQSFTLSRFMPPELMNYEGRALVIDPDIFALTDISELLGLEMENKSIACCAKKNAWDTSVMVLDCAKLRHWNIEEILQKLEKKELDYTDIITLKTEPEENIKELPRKWNNLDTLNSDTKMLHTTNRLTQPWKTGLPIDFTRNKMPKLFGVVPRESIHKLLGKYPTHYQPHPDKEIEKFFLQLTSDALKSSVITKEEIADEVSKKNIRDDIFKLINIE